MALLKLLAASLCMICLTIALSGYLVLAQLPPPNPSVAPLSAPVGPAQLPAPVTVQAAPSLVAVPTPAPASPTPLARVFNCSCAGAGVPTSWMGQVSAPGFFAARQAATGACLAYNQRRQPAPPELLTHQAAQFGPAASLPQGFENPNLAASAGAILPGTLTTSTATQLKACSQCACD
ncbi:MAG: hypothetical protein ACREQD_04430 [Candidatus Binataceae bacterium]